ncbi:MAG: RagB/SusD family nutrient uptake outer membrane protein [Prolixibacteraceae bacterium]
MKTKISQYILIAAFVALLFGCSKDFLETPNNAALTVENFYKNKDDLDKALTAAYAVFKAADLDDGLIIGQTFCHGHFLLGDANSDDAEVGGGIGEDPQMVAMSQCKALSDNYILADVWTGLYQGIYRSNLVIENAHNADGQLSEAEIEKYIAEAKFIRSYCYFHLVRVFGPVPLFTKTLGANDFYTVTRTPVAEVYHQIETDLQDAADALPWVESFDGHANRGSALGLLSKVLIFESSYAKNYSGDERFSGMQEKWDAAYASANEVIQSGKYNLSVNYSAIFHDEGENSKESVFEIEFMSAGDAYHGRNNGNTIATYYRSRSMGGWGFDLPSQNLVDAYENSSKTFVNGKWESTGKDSAEWQDPRMDWTIVFENEPAWFDPSYAMTNGEGQTQLYTGYCSQKILLPLITMPGNFSNSPNNIRLLRYSDVILIAAEAAYEKGDAATAISLVNQVRARARRDANNSSALPDVPSSVSGADLLNVIKHERRVELAMEGHRYWDLLRWGDAKQVLKDFYANNKLHNVDDPFEQGTNEFLPIPLSEIRNSKGALDQNSGY